MKTTYIYGVWDLDIHKFVYIGKSNVPQGRFEDHINGRGNEGVWEFVKEKGTDSFGLIILEKTIFSKLKSWVKRERFWIKKFREEGHPLCNKNSGGGGVTEHTEEWKREESKRKSGKRKSGENNPKYWLGKQRSEEFKVKMREANLGKHLTEETIAKIRKANSGMNHPNYGKHRTKETNLKIGRANAKPYPAFYNVNTQEYIPADKNLTKMCRNRGLSYWGFAGLRLNQIEQTRDGWRLAAALNL